jgi:hypothetical protein
MFRRAASVRNFLPFALGALAACGSQSGDPPAPENVNVLGQGLRISQVEDPSLQGHASMYGAAAGADVDITGTVVSWYDDFDETMDGKSLGTLYVQDLRSQTPPVPYSGIGVFAPAYIPADLRAVPGDVIDFDGLYQEQASIGTAIFDVPDVLPQLSKPGASFQYEYMPPAPAVLANPHDLDTFATGRPWLGMLVTINNLTIPDGGLVDTSNRVTYSPEPTVSGSYAISNELYDLKVSDFPSGTQFASVTGIVTWFYSYHIAPRSVCDLVVMGATPPAKCSNP